MTEFDTHWRDPAVAAVCARVRMQRDVEVESAYPARWIGEIEAAGDRSHRSFAGDARVVRFLD